MGMLSLILLDLLGGEVPCVLLFFILCYQSHSHFFPLDSSHVLTEQQQRTKSYPGSTHVWST